MPTVTVACLLLPPWSAIYRRHGRGLHGLQEVILDPVARSMLRCHVHYGRQRPAAAPAAVAAARDASWQPGRVRDDSSSLQDTKVPRSGVTHQAFPLIRTRYLGTSGTCVSQSAFGVETNTNQARTTGCSKFDLMPTKHLYISPAQTFYPMPHDTATCTSPLKWC